MAHQSPVTTHQCCVVISLYSSIPLFLSTHPGTHPNTMESQENLESIGEFTLSKLLCEGSMGNVWQAYRAGSNCKYAIKALDKHNIYF